MPWGAFAAWGPAGRAGGFPNQERPAADVGERTWWVSCFLGNAGSAGTRPPPVPRPAGPGAALVRRLLCLLCVRRPFLRGRRWLSSSLFLAVFSLWFFVSTVPTPVSFPFSFEALIYLPLPFSASL